MLDLLPADILYKILVHLPVDDLVRLEQVSKTLHNITQHRAIWSDAYEISTLPRPPGPFAWQSSTQLRSILETSARVDRNWPPHEESRFSVRNIQLGDHWYNTFNLVFGRWLFAATPKTVRLFDLDDKLVQGQKIYSVGDSESATMSSFRCVDIVTPEGRRAFAVCVQRAEINFVIKVFTITFEDERPVSFETILEIPTELLTLDRVDISPKGLIIRGPGLVADRHKHIWIMDIQTYQLYTLSTPPIEGRRSWHIIGMCVGNTHLFLVHSPPVPSASWRTYVEAFPLEPQEDGELHISHRSDCPDVMPLGTWRICDSGNVTFLGVEGTRCVLAEFSLSLTSPAENGVAPIDCIVSTVTGFPPASRRGMELRFQSTSAGDSERSRRILMIGPSISEHSLQPRLTGLKVTEDRSSDAFAEMGRGGGGIALATRRVPVNGARFGAQGVIGFDEAKGRVWLQAATSTATSNEERFIQVIDFR
ncbi:hypothetical protein BJ138DRAFT_1081744 [Hygrophoropsis aurantiaca]|uniref:Uncharacterized protein n=1 Tax=Hygrophoropsis aurantiaca TaxID=72124 RepID=A0ACB8AKR8_9AGAM|nr:hypothetical protein BJ138DRAFT_1081744 [Hygrophoropsis aurantiaca]